MPSVSIILPTFNAARFLPATLESVLNQTFEDWEAIVSDDGSTDHTVSIAREFAGRDKRIRVIGNEPSRHPGPPRNAAMRAAGGAYLAFLDSDDQWLPNKLMTQLEAIRAVSDPGICCSPAEDFGPEGEVCSRRAPRLAPPSDREAQYAQALLACNQGCTSSWLIERSFAEVVGFFNEDPKLAGYEDWDYFLRALERRSLVFIDKALVRYRVHPESITARNSDQWERRFEIYRRVEARGAMPHRLRRACYSTAWLVKGETLLELGAEGWRGAFLRALSMNPANWRRWPGLLALCLSRAMMTRVYGFMKKRQAGFERA